MRATTLLSAVLCLKGTKILELRFAPEGLLVAVAPRTRVPRCSECGGRGKRVHDRRWRKWRHLDLGGMALWLMYEQRRVECRRCRSNVVELVPWAAPWSWFTYSFEDAVGYLAQRTDKTTVVAQMRIAWETVGAILERVVKRKGPSDRLDGLRRIGIDELSYRKHHRYVTIVVDHDTGRTVWAAEGRNAETLERFFEALGPERCAKLEAVTTDMSESYLSVVRRRAPSAKIVVDRFHVQRLVHDALDEVRRAQVRELRGTEEGRAIKNTRWPLQKNAWNLNEIEEEKLARVQAKNRPLYRAYLLKAVLCALLDGGQPNVARRKIEEWASWASRSRLEPFRKAARTIRTYLEGIVEYVRTGLSNGRSEGLNAKIRTITSRSYGFHNVHSLIALIFLCCSGLRMQPVHTYPNLSRASLNL
jgi:transposase